MTTITNQETFVTKRNGRREMVFTDKISSRIRQLSYHLNDIDIPLIVQSVTEAITPGITTSELDDISGKTCSQLSIDHSDYGILASRIFASNLHKDTEKRFSSAMTRLYENPDTRSIIEPLYGTIIDFKDELDGMIIYDRDFRIPYKTLHRLKESNLLRIDGHVSERPQHFILRSILAKHGRDMNEIHKSYEQLSIQPELLSELVV